MYAQIKNGVIIKGPCKLPKTFNADDGCWITGFDTLSNVSLLDHGWYPVEYAELNNLQKHGEPEIKETYVYYPAISISREELKQRAKNTRDWEIQKNLSMFDSEWQVDSISRDRMQTAIYTVEYSGIDPNESVNWILADNTIRATNVNELRQILAGYAYRMQNIFIQYAAWLESDLSNNFELS